MTFSQRSRGGTTGYAMAARELRKDQNQESFRISQENLNTASARGAPDLIASRILPGSMISDRHLMSAKSGGSGRISLFGLIGQIGWIGLSAIVSR